MLSLYTESTICPNCKAEFDVPIYTNNDGVKKYGYHFCNQCGASLYFENSDMRLIHKNFLHWIVDNCYLSFCDHSECNRCPFSINRNGFHIQCDELNDEQKLQVFKQIYDSE